MIKKKQLTLLTLLIFVPIITVTSLNVTTDPERIECPDIRDINIENGGHQFCNCTYKNFRRRYNVANLKLTSFLKKLKTWNCPQFKEECKNRYFDFNRFTFLVYEKFCNNSNFKRVCSKELRTIHDVYDLKPLKTRKYFAKWQQLYSHS